MRAIGLAVCRHASSPSSRRGNNLPVPSPPGSKCGMLASHAAINAASCYAGVNGFNHHRARRHICGIRRQATREPIINASTMARQAGGIWRGEASRRGDTISGTMG